MKEFRELVRQAIVDRKGQPIPNGTIEHAVILIEEMLMHTKNTFRLFSSLTESVYGRSSIVNATKDFISQPNSHLDIVFDKEMTREAAASHPLIKNISKQGQGIVRVFAPKQLTQNIPFHFATADDWGYRYEPDKTKFSAVGVFGDNAVVKSLTDLFESFVAKSEQII